MVDIKKKTNAGACITAVARSTARSTKNSMSILWKFGKEHWPEKQDIGPDVHIPKIT